MPENENLALVCPMYNGARFLESLLAERERAQGLLRMPVTLILVDDGSKDQTKAELQKLASQPMVKVVTHQKNQGQQYAILSGLSAVSEKYAVVVEQDISENYDLAALDEMLERARCGAAVVIARRPKFRLFSIRGFISRIIFPLFGWAFYFGRPEEWGNFRLLTYEARLKLLHLHGSTPKLPLLDADVRFLALNIETVPATAKKDHQKTKSSYTLLGRFFYVSRLVFGHSILNIFRRRKSQDTEC